MHAANAIVADTVLTGVLSIIGTQFAAAGIRLTKL